MKTVAIALIAANVIAAAALASALPGSHAPAEQAVSVSPADFLLCDLNPDDWRCEG